MIRVFSLLCTGYAGILLGICTLLVFSCAVTRAVTTVLFYNTVRRNRAVNNGPKRPPMLPYTIPWLGHALQLVNKAPRAFYITLQRALTENDLTICTVLLAGERAHVINSATAVQTLLKNKHSGRHLNERIGMGALGASAEDTAIMFPLPGEHDNGEKLEEINNTYLLSQSAVTKLTDRYLDFLQAELKSHGIGEEWVEVDLLAFLQSQMFKSAVSTVLGTKVYESNPHYLQHYVAFEEGMIPRTIGIPRWWDVNVDRGMRELQCGTEAHLREALKQCGSEASKAPEWEPWLGSSFNRARHDYYQREGVSLPGQAAFDNGVLFGLNANTLPITGWLMAHLLAPHNPANVLERVRTEIDGSRRPDGSIDISVLKSKPLLNAALEETLRMYVDTLITRRLYRDIVVDDFLFKSGELVLMPSALAHYDAAFWSAGEKAPLPEIWHAERFLRLDPATGTKICSTSWAAGKLIPWGGGREMCPGRVFAKQELVATIAIIFLTFDVEFVEFLGVDPNGKPSSRGRGRDGFPKVKRQYSGNGTLKGDGDIRVKLRQRRW